MATDLRCSDVSELLGEPLAATAPTDERWLFLEQPGPWGPKVELEVEGHRVQWIRGVGRTEATAADRGSRRAFRADLRRGAPVRLSTTTVDSADDLATATWRPHHEPLWLVCTNGRRDECCATRGRPVAAALAARWPEHTWETTHLGGHRFAPTLLALPSGYVLGRVPPDRAVGAAEQVLAGDLPLDLVRGHAGFPPEAQAAELHVRTTHGLTGLDDATCAEVDALAASVHVEATTAEPRRLSCVDVTGRPVTTYSATPRGTSAP